MRKILLLLLSLTLLAGFCEAQILVVRFKDEKVAKRYKKHLTPYGGESVLLGEPVVGGGIVIRDNNIQYRGPNPDPRANDQNEFFVLDHKNPETVPYEIEDGEKVSKSRKAVVAIPGADIENLSFFMRSEDLYSLAREFRFRRGRVDKNRSERDECAKGSAEWFRKHRLLVLEYLRLRSWLNEISFTEVAKKLQKEIDKEQTISKKEALDARWKTAAASVHDADTPEALTEASQAITGGATKFHVQESQHVRIVHLEELSHARVKGLLELAEELIEGFRVEFVDPYVAEDFEDRIPDGLFIEFFFCRDEAEDHRRFIEEYYQGRVPDPARQAEMNGHRTLRALMPKILEIWRYDETEDLEGLVLHGVGHALADYHFNSGPMAMNQPWIEEGLAYYASFEYTGRNSVTCKEFRESDYVKQVGKEGEKNMMGLRDIYNRTALEQGRKLDKIALLYLFDLESGDLAKSWSVFDWVAKELGKEGQLWLRAGCQAARTRDTFLAEWRTASQTVFGVGPEEDIYRIIDDRWRAYAESQQDTSESSRPSRKK